MPTLWSTGTGADVMKRVAAPRMDGHLPSFRMEIVVYPASDLPWQKLKLAARTAPP
jgi:Cu(I)/Ag(I) efflux system membrane protein CusA/SilA